MSKAIAPHTLFIIATIAFFLLFIFGLFFQWIETNNFASNQATCTLKKISYCGEWVRTGNTPGTDSWEKKSPDCGTRPECSECKSITQGSLCNPIVGKSAPSCCK